MSFTEKVSAGADRVVKEAEKAIDKGKAKLSELQIEMHMDGQAKKLGYLVFDFYRGREVDQAQRQQYLDEMTRLEDQLLQARADAAAKKQAQAEEKARQQEEPAPVAPDDVWQQGPAAGAAGAEAASEQAADAAAAATPPSSASSYPPVPPTEPDCNIPASASEAAKQSTEETFKDDGTWPRGDA